VGRVDPAAEHLAPGRERGQLAEGRLANPPADREGLVVEGCGERALTTSALSAELADIPTASLYRHVARLVDAGVLAVLAERRVRGALERTYVLRLTATSIGPDQLAAMSADDHREAFMAFVAGLLGDFDRYLARGQIDLLRDGVSYRIAGLWLDDAEFTELLRELGRVLERRLANPPGSGRKRRILASVLLPASEAPS
jgi:hypothetical protein